MIPFEDDGEEAEEIGEVEEEEEGEEEDDEVEQEQEEQQQQRQQQQQREMVGRSKNAKIQNREFPVSQDFSDESESSIAVFIYNLCAIPISV